MKEQEPVVTVEKKARKAARKRSLKAPATFALPVRTLWELATAEQRERAQEAGVAILEYWTGRITKAEVAKRLNLPPVRVWQLSQQATSGMIAGLLVQPKTRAKGVPMSPSEDPKALQRRVAELEEMNRKQELLIMVLRSMPGSREAPKKEEPKDGGAKAEGIKGVRHENRARTPRGEKA
jgi:hypothetical protein